MNKKASELVFTIHSDEEIEDESSSEEEVEEESAFLGTFDFDFGGRKKKEVQDNDVSTIRTESVPLFQNNVKPVANIFNSVNEEHDEDEDDDEGDSDDSSKTRKSRDRIKKVKNIEHHRNTSKIQPPPPVRRKKRGEEDDEEEEEYDKTFFASESTSTPEVSSFKKLHLSKPILQALDRISFHTPTPVQRKSIPLLLQGKNLCGSAVTGSGKTAAFLVPTLERLMYRNKKDQKIRVLILLPTRELAVQCQKVCLDLRIYTDISCGLVIGGDENMRRQKRLVLVEQPDILICTPGRLISHLLQSDWNFLKDLEILVLDEADRLLELGFIEEVQKILEYLPKDRQSVLFSATMTDDVEQLVNLSFSSPPVRVCLDPRNDVPGSLEQEFVRIRDFSGAGNEEKERSYRESVLCSLCFNSLPQLFKERRRRNRKKKKKKKNNNEEEKEINTFQVEKTIIFVNRKIDARRLKIVFLLFGIKCSELHGDLTLPQRLAELERFKRGITKFLITTDVGSRGIDIIDVSIVINFFMPHSLKLYIHRVGRTARMGRSGISVSLIDESSRPLLRQVIKRARQRGEGEGVRQRVIDNETLLYYISKLNDLEKLIKKHFHAGIYQKELERSEMMIKRTNELLYQSRYQKEQQRKQNKKKNDDLPIPILTSGAPWFQSKLETEMNRKKEKELKGISRSGRKRLRDVLEFNNTNNSSGRSRRRRKRRKLEVEEDEEMRRREVMKGGQNLMKVSKVRERARKKKKIQNLGSGGVRNEYQYRHHQQLQQKKGGQKKRRKRKKKGVRE